MYTGYDSKCTLFSHIIPPSVSAQDIPLNHFFNTFLANDAAAIHMQVKNGGCNILQGILLLRVDADFVSPVTHSQVHNWA